MANNDRDQEEMHTTRESKQGNNDVQQESGEAEKETTKGKGRPGRSGQAMAGNKGGSQMTGSGTNGISEDDEDLGGRAGNSGGQAGSTPRSGNSGS